MSDANDMTALHLTTIAFRMQCRVDVCLERNGGDEEAATTSSGIGISYGFAHEIARTCEGAAEQFATADAEITRLRTALATCVEALKRIEMRTLDDYPPFRSAPVEAFLPIIRQALVLARDVAQKDS